MPEKEYSVIYLAPPCFGFERNWCKDDAPADCDCPNGPHPWVKFVNEAELTTLRAQNEMRTAELDFAVEKMAAYRAENELLREAVKVADDAINEMFRYFDGGETRGSYDGKPERAQLRKAGYATRNALAQVGQ